MQVLIDESGRADGGWWTDVADCFEAIPHNELIQALEERVYDRGALTLLWALLCAGVMKDGALRWPVTGPPQAG